VKRLIQATLDDNCDIWGENTLKQAEADANALYDVLLIEYGVEQALALLIKNGYSPDGEYRYVAEPLFSKALERKANRLANK
jgi:hypothetical protein